MICLKRYIILLYFTFPVNHAAAQKNITGTWEGNFGYDQFLQLNIIQNGDKICGYTWDYLWKDKKSYCKAYFEGRYDKKKRKLIISGKSFIENSGLHTLMNLSLDYRKVKGKEVLEIIPEPRPILSPMQQDLDEFFRQLRLFRDSDSTTDYVHLVKISDKPYEILDQMQDCMFKDMNLKDPSAKVVVPRKTNDSLPVAAVLKNKNNIIKDSVTVPEQVLKRKNTEQSHLEVNEKNITLNVYDNAINDGDTISIFYNGKLLLSHQRLSEKPIVINLQLDEKQTRHEIILFAENLGSIPPNTALIVIYAGDKRYELFSSASLEENAVLILDYRPKK